MVILQKMWEREAGTKKKINITHNHSLSGDNSYEHLIHFPSVFVLFAFISVDPNTIIPCVTFEVVFIYYIIHAFHIIKCSST